MAGTDSNLVAKADAVTGPGPAVILIAPQMGENIGAVARAMLNCGLSDLRLVNPREAWPNDRARTMAAGADQVLERTRLFTSVADAVADIHHLYATTARTRDMAKAYMTPRQAAAELRAYEAKGDATGIMFGPERAGLDSDDFALADVVIEAPLNPGFASLNLGQAVLIIAYEWFQAGFEEREVQVGKNPEPPASREDLHRMFAHLEGELDAKGYLEPAHKRPHMVRNIRTMLLRAHFTENEVRALRGMITALARPKRGKS